MSNICVTQKSRVRCVIRSFLPSVYFVMIKEQYKIGKKLSLEINLLLVWGSFFSEASLPCELHSCVAVFPFVLLKHLGNNWRHG